MIDVANEARVSQTTVSLVLNHADGARLSPATRQRVIKAAAKLGYQPVRRGGPLLWFGGSSVHPRLLARMVRYGSGFNPLGTPSDDELGRLAAAGCGPDRIEYVGGTRGVFPDPDSLADLDSALATIPGQLARGFRTICIKPSQFIDYSNAIASFCADVVNKTRAY